MRIRSNTNTSATGNIGYFWSSSPIGGETNILRLDYNTSIRANVVQIRADALPVRCFKNAISLPPSISSVSYNPVQGTWTNGDVTVTVTLDQNGAPLAGWLQNGKVFTKTFTSN
jgi:hypothetical protein